MIKQLQQNILTNLPAWEAHKKMAPPIRKPGAQIPTSVRYGAVCILLYYKKNELHTLLIKRTEDGGTHSGQIALPGGKVDANDFSFTHCALRECEEEIGHKQEKIKIIGSLTPLYIPPSNYIVAPIVCFSQEVKNLVASPNEVAEIIEVPLAYFFLNENKGTKTVKQSNDHTQTMETPIYTYAHHIIWGATAMMLAEFEEIYQRTQTGTN